LTGIYSESYSGGRVPEAIDAAGFDAVVISGKSSVPLVLSIYPGGALFHEALDLWGKETYETEDIVPERFGPAACSFKKRGVVVIGPAGENLVRFAVISNDRWRCAGRTGVGTVMGAKKLVLSSFLCKIFIGQLFKERQIFTHFSYGV
jgi:aldehyde:ferredoxin oxidoreductase